MKTLSTIDPEADVACTLPVNEAGERLTVLQTIVGDHLESVTRDSDRLVIRLDRAGEADLDVRVEEWAEAERACCGFLGFAIDAEPEAVVLAISAPASAVGTLDGIEWLVRAAARGDA